MKIFIFLTCIAMNIAGFNGKLPEFDFAVTDFIQHTDGFIYVKLENKSDTSLNLQEAVLNKIFLVIYIDSIKRAEYKLKYFDRQLFTAKSQVLFRTNFRSRSKIILRAEINMGRIFAESIFHNNILERSIEKHE